MADSPAIDIHFLDPHSPGGPDDDLRDRLYVVLDDFQPLAIAEGDSADCWRVYFGSRTARDAALGAVLAGLPGQVIDATSVDEPDQDWARRSQQGLKAVRAGGLIVAPPWDVPTSGDVPVLIIEPSTGFGTGHHATTRLCLEMLQRLELRGARVIDVGTGSGVLALAAWKFGAADIAAIDNDPDALENARANIARNGAGASIDVILDGIESLRIERGDIVLANLTGAALLRYSTELTGLLRDEAYLVLSGFAPDDVPVVETAFKSLHEIDCETDGDWAAICLRAG